MKFRKSRFGLVLLLAIFCARLAPGGPLPVSLKGSVFDEDGKPVADAEVRIQTPSGQSQLFHTDKSGTFEVSFENSGEYRVSLNKIGFFRLAERSIQLKEGDNTVSLSINHETEIHEEVEVYSSTESLRPLETSHQDSMIAREIRDIPVPTTHDLRSSLEILPEVVRDRSGELHVAGGRASETQYLLDGFEIGDPVTGSLSVRVNVDSVRVAEAESGRFGTQYGSAGAGILQVDTDVGEDRWHAGATNFLPGFSTDRGIHFSSWYPRLTLSGPLRRGRAWFSEAISLQHTISLVREQPEDADSITQWAGDNMLRTQIKLSRKNMLQINFLYNQRNASNLGLGPFSPVSTTRVFQAYRSFVSAKEQVWSGRTFYELGLAADIGHDETLPRGFEPYMVTPDGAAGNYFESLKQQTRRWQGFGSVTFPTRQWHGTHDLQIGFNIASKGWTQSSLRNDIEVRRMNGTVAQHTVFSGQPQFHLSDTTAGGYTHDTWRVAKSLVLQFGLRTDWDRILQTTTVSPRISGNLLPFENEDTKFTAAWGTYLQPLALSNIGPAYDQQRSDTFFDQAGNSESGPITSRFLLPDERLKQPRFYTFSAGWEQAIGSRTHADINFTRRNGRFGLAYEKVNVDPSLNLFVLQNFRRDTYRSLQFSFRHSFSDKAGLSWSFTRSSARTNQVFDYSLETPVFSPQESGPLAWDAPNRLVSSGWAPVPVWGLFFSYFFEYRSGFPFSLVSEQQQLVGVANSMRFPDYAGLNLGIEKRIHLLTRDWAVRLTILNVTNNFNPDTVNNNVDSPNFMRSGGGQGRSFTARVRLVG